MTKKKKNETPIDIKLLEEDVPSESWKKDKLIKYAGDRNIPIDKKSHKRDILQQIKHQLMIVPASQLDGDDSPFRAMDAFDTDIIIQEIMGQVDTNFKDAYIYEFPGKKKNPVSGTWENIIIRGFTKPGVDEMSLICAEYLNIVFRIQEGTVMVEETDDSFKAIVLVGRYQLRPAPIICPHCKESTGTGGVAEVLIDTMIGAARQPKRIRLQKGGFKDNEFAFRVSISKAVRNGKLSLMSHEFKTKMMSYLLGEREIKMLPPSKERVGKVILLEGSSYIDETQRRKLHSIAGERGMSHDKILKIIGEFGIDSTNNILEADFKNIIKKIKAHGEPVELTDDLKKGLSIYGKTEDWGLARLRAGVAKGLTVEEAVQKLFEWLNRQIEAKEAK